MKDAANLREPFFTLTLGPHGLSVHPAECLVVEDAIAGVEAGKAAGCRVLALTTSFPAGKMAEADWIIRDLSHAGPEVLDW